MERIQEKEFKNLTLENANFKPFYMLIKFQSKERLEDLQNGHIYMKNLKYFIDLERVYKQEGQGDQNECRMFKAFNLKLTEHLTGKTIELESVDISNAESIHKPVFCMTHKDICEKMIKLEYPKFKTTISVSKQIIDDFSEEGVELYALLINKGEFLRRIANELDNLKIPFRYGRVSYKDTSIFEFSSETKEVYFNTEFNKDERFSHQEEFRIILDINVENYFDFNIGDIRDISMLMPARYLLEGITMEGKIGRLIEV